jgi:hypothetical protein
MINYRKLNKEAVQRQKEEKTRAKIQKLLAWIGLISLFALGLSFFYRAVVLLIDII